MFLLQETWLTGTTAILPFTAWRGQGSGWGNSGSLVICCYVTMGTQLKVLQISDLCWAQPGSSSPSCGVTGWWWWGGLQSSGDPKALEHPRRLTYVLVVHISSPVLWPHARGWSSSRQGVWVARGESFPRVHFRREGSRSYGPLQGARGPRAITSAPSVGQPQRRSGIPP